MIAISLFLPFSGFSDDTEEWAQTVFFLPKRIIDSYFPWGETYLIPHDPAFSANIKRAGEFELKNDYRQAARYYFLAYKKAQNTPKAPYILFKQSTIVEDIYQSIKNLEEILEVYPDFPLIDAVRFELAKQFFILKDYEDASRVLMEIEKNEKEQSPIFLPFVYTFLGVINYKLSEYEEAAEYYALSNKILASGDTTLDRIPIINNYFELSRALEGSSDYENAEEILKRILGTVQSDVLKQEALLRIGFLKKRKGDIAGAFSAFNSIVQENPGTLFALKAQKGIQELGVQNKDSGLIPISGIFDHNILDGTYTMEANEEIVDEDGEEGDEVILPPRQGYAVQLGSFSDEKNAEKMVLVLVDEGFEAYSISASIDDKLVFRVRVGTVSSRGDAEELKETLTGLGYEGFIVEEK
jgi:tetratricopeptide (TPR) repeat protein